MSAAPSSPTPVLAVRNLVKSYGEATVLAGVSFEVQAGECLVILGRSGSGKSVLLRQLNGLESPEAGEVSFAGSEISELTERELLPVRRRVAMLFQSGALFDSMTVFENIAFPLREHRRMREAELREIVAAKLALVGLFGVEEKMPSDLSGGMKKRVALARSLALEPEVVLFDEPTTGLDPVTAATIARLIERTREMGVTCVVVTHDLHLARRVADRLIFLDRGRIRFEGTWEEAERSADPHLTAFLAGREENDDAA